MKKTLLSLLLAICMIIPCVFALTACSETPPPADSQNLTKVEYAQAFAGVQNAYSDYVNTETQRASVSLKSASFDDNDLITLDRENQMMRMATACVQFVGFLENLCENPTYELTTDFQEMSVVDTSVSGYVGNYKLRVKMDYNAETKLIISEVYCDDGSYKTYLVFEIMFDFETETLDYFTITGAMGATLNASCVNYFKFQDNTFKMLPQTSERFTAYAESILSTCDVLIATVWGANLPDYSEEYVNAMLGN